MHDFFFYVQVKKSGIKSFSERVTGTTQVTGGVPFTPSFPVYLILTN